MCRQLVINLYCAKHNPRVCFGLPAEALSEDDKTYLSNKLTFSREGIVPCADEQHCQGSAPQGEAIELLGGWGTCSGCRLANAHRLVDAQSQIHNPFRRRSRNDKANKARDEAEAYERVGFEELLDIPAGTEIPMGAHYPWQRNLGRDGQTLHLEALKDKLDALEAEYYIYEDGTVSYSGGVDGPPRYEFFGRRGRFCVF